MAILVVTSGGFVNDVTTGVGDLADRVTDGVASVVDGLNNVGKTLGNGIESVRESPGNGPIVSGDPDDYSEERQTADASVDAIESAMNTNEDLWVIAGKSVIRGNVTNYETVNIVVIEPQDGKGIAIGANYTASFNWSNVSVEDGEATLKGDVVEIEDGLANDSDMTVYPKTEDIAFYNDNYEDIANLDTDSTTGSELWERVMNTRVTPEEKGDDLKQTYKDEIVDYVIGALSR